MTITPPIDIFLLTGQSNMAGRGSLAEVAPLSHPQLLMFRASAWQPAVEPLHTDRPRFAGIGLGMSFGIELLKAMPEARIGLVPCAFGGSPLKRWMPGEDLFTSAVSIARQALSGGTLKGILWHQGEADSAALENARSYGQRFQTMISGLRASLNAPELPVVAGELGLFLDERVCPHFRIVNQQLREMEGVIPAYRCVSSAGLTDKGDRTHFNAVALREFGVRYARQYARLIQAKPC